MERIMRVAAVAMTVGLSGVAAARPTSDAIAYEGFSYGHLGDLAGSAGGSGWSGAWMDVGAGPIGASQVGLTYPGLASRGGAAVVAPMDPTQGYATYTRTLAPFTVGSDRMFLSFLMRPDAGYGSICELQFFGYPRAVHVGVPGGYYLYGLNYGEGYFPVVSTVPETQGEVALLVVEMVLQPAAARTTYNLFVDPVVGTGRPAFPAATMTVAGGVAPTFMSMVTDGGVTFDEIRLGRTWASVVPCRADVNSDGVVTSQDFFDFLGSFFAGSADGDFNHDGVVTSQDFFDFLGGFFAGC